MNGAVYKSSYPGKQGAGGSKLLDTNFIAILRNNFFQALAKLKFEKNQNQSFGEI